jgi:hypothetical protein
MFIPNELKAFGTELARSRWFMKCAHIEDMDIPVSNKVIEPELLTTRSFFAALIFSLRRKNQGLDR